MRRLSAEGGMWAFVGFEAEQFLGCGSGLPLRASKGEWSPSWAQSSEARGLKGACLKLAQGSCCGPFWAAEGMHKRKEWKPIQRYGT